MEKERNIIKMIIYYMKVIQSMVNLKEMENITMKMVVIIQVNLKMVYLMEKGHIMIKMEI